MSRFSRESDRAILPLTAYLPKRESDKNRTDGGFNINVADPLQSLSAGNLATSGAFAIQQDFDNNYVITNLDFIKRMLNLKPDEYGSVEIALQQGADEKKIKEEK